ncbi:MAG: FAD-binding protein, partial [Pseudomonadota bacterium]
MAINAAVTEIDAILGQRVSVSKPDLYQHGLSETHFPPTPPDAVVYPETTEEVAGIVRVCARHQIPVIGWGTGTSLEGQTQAVEGGVCVDFSRMNKILAIAQGDMDARLQPGVTREALNDHLRATGLFFPVDPGANASLGGMASTRASGTTAVRYGTMRDNVLGLEIVTAQGDILRTGTRARKSAAGYDLTALFVGAEGTLGLITELTLRLQGIPEAISAAVCAFDSVEAAVETAMATVQLGVPMARIELMDTQSVEAVNAHAGSDFPACPHLFLEFHGTEAGVAEQVDAFGALAQDFGGKGFDWARRTEDRNALWAMRHNAYHAITAARPGTKALVTDLCVPIS